MLTAYTQSLVGLHCAGWFVIFFLYIRKNRHSNFTRLRIRVCNGKILFLIFHKENICCECSKEPSQRDGLFVPKHMFKVMGKKLITKFT